MVLISGARKQNEAAHLHAEGIGFVRRFAVLALQTHAAIARRRYVSIAIHGIHDAAMTAGSNNLVTEQFSSAIMAR